MYALVVWWLVGGLMVGWCIDWWVVCIGFDWYTAYNPDFVLELAREYMTHVGTEPAQAGDPPNPLLNKLADLLSHLTMFVPGNKIHTIPHTSSIPSGCCSDGSFQPMLLWL